MDSQNVTWKWEYCDNLPYLTCSLLTDFKHGFFTQQFYPQTPENLTTILADQAQSYRLQQVHGNTVLSPTEFSPLENQFPAADGLITDAHNQAVWVASADCTPVLIADRLTGQVAAVHAGWRGTAKKIVPQAIARLQNQGSSIENLTILLGPAISGGVYQVTESVAAEVCASFIQKTETMALEAILEASRAIINSPLQPDSETGKVRLDVRRVNQIQMEQLGIKAEKVAIAPHCTYQQPEYFFSYRRTQEKKVQWSGIVSKKVF